MREPDKQADRSLFLEHAAGVPQIIRKKLARDFLNYLLDIFPILLIRPEKYIRTLEIKNAVVFIRIKASVPLHKCAYRFFVQTVLINAIQF